MEKSVITRNNKEFLTYETLLQIYFTFSMLRTIFWQYYRERKG